MRATIGISLLHLQNWSGTGSYTQQLLQALASCHNRSFEVIPLLNKRNSTGLSSSRLELPFEENALKVPLWQLRWPLAWGADWIGNDWSRKLRTGASSRCLVHYPSGVGPPVSQVPLVITLHDVAPFLFPELFPRRKGSYLRMVFSRVVAVAQIILADTEWQAQKIGEVFPVAGHKIQVLPLTVDPIFTKEAPSQTGRALCPETRERPFFLSVGTLEPRKNIPRLIDAWQHLDIDCDLVMVGRWGWRVSEIQHRLRTGGKYQLLPQGESWLFPSGNRIIRYEYLPAEDLTSLYHTAVGLVYPSLFEGFGLPVLEAMSCGCPVVTSQDSAMAEVAQEAAWLCDPLDEDSLGEAMCRLNSDWVEREKKKRSGLKRAQQFSQEKFAASLLTVYHSILDEGFA